MSSPGEQNRAISWRWTLGLLLLLAVLAWSGFRVSQVWQAGSRWQAAEQALARHDLAAARAQLLQYREIQPDDPEVHFLLGRIARRTGEESEALEHYRQCQQRGGVPEALELERMLLRAQKGDLDKAEGLLWAYVEKQHPDRLLILEALSMGYLQSFRLRQALDCLQRWLAEEPGAVPALWWQAQVLYRLRLRQEAIPVLETLLQLAPDHEAGRLSLANCLSQNSRPREALEQFDQALERNPDSADAQLGRARCLLDLGHAEEARDVLDPFLSHYPRAFEAQLLRGKVDVVLARPAQGEPWMRRAVELAPNDRDAVYSLARCLGQLNRKAEADTFFERFKRIDRDQVRLRVLTQQILANPKDAGLRCQAGEVFLSIGEDQEGLRWLRSALEVNSRHEQTHRILSKYYREHNRLDLAALHEQASASPP